MNLNLNLFSGAPLSAEKDARIETSAKLQISNVVNFADTGNRNKKDKIEC